DLEVTWGKVWVKLRTHSSNGVTERDFALAHRLDEAILWRPAAGSHMEGTPNKWVKAGSPHKPARARTLTEIGIPRSGAQDPVRARQARRAGAARHTRAHGAGLSVRGRRPPHHGRRPDDDLVDRPTSHRDR